MNAIFTCCDAKYGDFLVKHWLRSLQKNTDLAGVEIIILDYGLTDRQRSTLIKKGAIIKRCIKDGHVTSVRFRDMAAILEKSSYEQVLSADGGDMIFQTDISPLFSANMGTFRAAYDVNNHIINHFPVHIFFRQDYAGKIRQDLKKRKKTINAGLLVGPRDRFIQLCREYLRTVTTTKSYGPDQVAIDHILHRDGFHVLDPSYNFIPTNAEEFQIRSGIFYFKDDTIIPVVHNAGGTETFRIVKEFGYGRGFNKIDKASLVGVNLMHKAVKKIDDLTDRRSS